MSRLAEPITINVQQGAKATPAQYTVPGAVDIEPLSAFAHYDGTSAASAFRPALTFYSDAGLILARVFPSASVPVGGTADVTFAPFLGSGGGGAGSGAEFDIKVFDDSSAAVVVDGAFEFAIPASIDGATLSSVAAYVTTVSSAGAVTVQIRNTTTVADVLSTPITIDVSEFTSYTAATPAVIDPAEAVVTQADIIAIDIDTAGTGAKGLGVILGYS